MAQPVRIYFGHCFRLFFGITSSLLPPIFFPLIATILIPYIFITCVLRSIQFIIFASPSCFLSFHLLRGFRCKSLSHIKQTACLAHRNYWSASVRRQDFLNPTVLTNGRCSGVAALRVRPFVLRVTAPLRSRETEHVDPIAYICPCCPVSLGPFLHLNQFKTSSVWTAPYCFMFLASLPVPPGESDRHRLGQGYSGEGGGA